MGGFGDLEPTSAQTAAAVYISSKESELTPLSKQTKGSSLKPETSDICKTHATALDSDEKHSRLHKYLLS